MSKILIANKVKDGWYVQIIDSRHEDSEDDVRKLARQEGLKIKEDLSFLYKGVKIVAE